MASRIYQPEMRSALSRIFRQTSSCQLRGLSTTTRDRGVGFGRNKWTTATPACGSQRCFRTSVTLEDTYRVNMPSLSPTMTEGTIVKWMKKEGDPITAGDVLCEIQTDKAVVSMEHDEDGILAKILVPENSADVKVGQLIALTVDEGDDWKGVEIPKDAGATPPPPSSASSTSSSPPKTATGSPKSTSSHGSDRLVGPAVKNYLRQYGLVPWNVPGSGPHGTLTKGDVLKHVQANKLVPVAAGSSSSSGPSQAASGPSKISRPSKSTGGSASFVDLEISNMRRTIAKRLHQSKSTVPHAYATVQCNLKGLASFRKTLTSAGLKVSVNDLIIKCVANALALNPSVNCTWEGSQLRHQSQVDISVAVATPNGLITPIVPNTGGKDVISISEIVRNLAAKAKDGKLQPHEFMGGTFSISNLGMFGIHSFTAIINPPQCAILAVGGPVIELDENGEPLSTVKLQLSYDASAIMEDDALKFLAVLRNELENVNEISMGIYSLEARKEELEQEQVAAIAQ